MASNINSETGEYIGTDGRSPRLTSWVMMMVCSCVTLSASVQVKKDMDEANEAAKWAVGGSTFAFIVSFFIFLTHLHPIASTLVVGSYFEGISAFIMMIVWSAVVSIVTKTGNDLGVVRSDTNQVGNGNLYYFSWGGFVLSFVLMSSYIRSALGLDLVGTINGRGQRLTLWAGYLAASIVILGSSGRVLNEDCNGEQEVDAFPEEYCKRTKLAIGLGSVGFVTSVIVFIMKLCSQSSHTMSECWLSCLLASLGAVGVGFITSNKGPGRAIGNLYYFSWIACILAAMIAVECFNAGKGSDEVAPTTSEEPRKPDFPVESMEDHELP